MSLVNFFLMISTGIFLILISRKKTLSSKSFYKHLTPLMLNIFRITGWTFLLFAIYDRFIVFVLMK